MNGKSVQSSSPLSAGVNTYGNIVHMSGYCSKCAKTCDNKCERCGDFYCSEICQTKDWQRHRFICFPMPKLVKVYLSTCENNSNVPEQQSDITFLKLPKDYKVLPNRSCVILTAFKSTNRCFIRSANPFLAKAYDQILKEIDEFGQKSTPLTQKPHNNYNAVTLNDEKWCRVNVFITRGDQCRLNFTDSGQIGQKHFKCLRKVTPSIANLPCLIQEVQLKNIKHLKVDSKLLNSLDKFVNEKYMIVFEQPEKSAGDVKLFPCGLDVSLNSLIEDIVNKYKETEKDGDNSVVSSMGGSPSNAHLNKKEAKLDTNKLEDCKSLKTKANSDSITKNSHTEVSEKNAENGLVAKLPTAPPEKEKPCLNPPFKTIAINENDVNCKVLILDNSYIESGFIGCLLEKHYDNLKSISKFLKEHNSGSQPYKPKLYEYCLANYEGDWYRAQVGEIISEDNFLVVYTDFSNEQELSSQSIRPYPMSLTLPCYTTVCAIDGLPEDKTSELKKCLEETCAAFSFLKIDSFRLKDDIPFIKSNELLKKCHILK